MEAFWSSPLCVFRGIPLGRGGGRGVFGDRGFAMIAFEQVSKFASIFNKQEGCLKFVKVRGIEGSVCKG